MLRDLVFVVAGDVKNLRPRTITARLRGTIESNLFSSEAAGS